MRAKKQDRKCCVQWLLCTSKTSSISCGTLNHYNSWNRRSFPITMRLSRKQKRNQSQRQRETVEIEQENLQAPFYIDGDGGFFIIVGQIIVADQSTEIGHRLIFSRLSEPRSRTDNVWWLPCTRKTPSILCDILKRQKRGKRRSVPSIMRLSRKQKRIHSQREREREIVEIEQRISKAPFYIDGDGGFFIIMGQIIATEIGCRRLVDDNNHRQRWLAKWREKSAKTKHSSSSWSAVARKQQLFSKQKEERIRAVPGKAYTPQAGSFMWEKFGVNVGVI